MRIGHSSISAYTDGQQRPHDIKNSETNPFSLISDKHLIAVELETILGELGMRQDGKLDYHRTALRH